MIRVQQELARYASEHRPDVIFTIFDPYRNRPRAIRQEWIDAVVENTASIEPSLVWNPGAERYARRRQMARPVVEALFWATRFRRKLLSELQRTILSSPPARPWQERMLRGLMKEREHSLYLNDDDSLRACPPLDMLLHDTLDIAPGDVFITAQSDWYHIDLDAIIAEQSRGLRRVVLCYDIIPILFPQWYSPQDAAAFEHYYARTFATADRIIFNARSSERDARQYSRSLGFDLADTRIVPLGCDFSVPGNDSGSLPAGLKVGNFAVYVSTIEPRKNHRVLIEAWSKLIADAVPGEDFKLVFVGRAGWMMDDFFAELAANPQFGRSIIHLDRVPDTLVRTLYANAAFSLYPSIYEGYGLPPIESMLVGTPVIASNGGAIPEVVKEACLCLDPADSEAWYRAIRRMISDHTYRHTWADRASAFKPTSWRQAAEQFFAAVEEPFTERSPALPPRQTRLQ
jgi:glycosyltransferase involved in cell wall biosynthesis